MGRISTIPYRSRMGSHTTGIEQNVRQAVPKCISRYFDPYARALITSNSKPTIIIGEESVSFIHLQIRDSAVLSIQ